jgi:hypothetical protein
MPILVEGVTIDANYYIFQGDSFTAAVLLGVLIWGNNVTSTYQSNVLCMIKRALTFITLLKQSIK